MSDAIAYLQKKKQERDNGSEKDLKDFESYNGMTFDVCDLGENSLFEAKFVIASEGMMFEQSSGFVRGEDIDFIESATIRGFNYGKKKTVYMKGNMVKKGEGMWFSPDLRIVKVVKDRAFYRLNVDLDGDTRPADDRKAAPVPCTVADISVGGTKLISEAIFDIGDIILLCVTLDENIPESEIQCRVMRTSKTPDGKYVYNCRFKNLDEDSRAVLTRDIFRAQIANKR